MKHHHGQRPTKSCGQQHLSRVSWEAINGNVPAAERKANEDYRTKRNLELMVYLAGGVHAQPT